MPIPGGRRGLPGVDDALVGALRTFVGPENPPVNALAKVAGAVTGPENPPVDFLLKVLQRADPGGTANFLNPLGMIPATVTAHASPHIFKKPLVSKMGTGEGAQSYGPGLYSSSSPQMVDSHYRERLLRSKGMEWQPKLYVNDQEIGALLDGMLTGEDASKGFMLARNGYIDKAGDPAYLEWESKLNALRAAHDRFRSMPSDLKEIGNFPMFMRDEVHQVLDNYARQGGYAPEIREEYARARDWWGKNWQKYELRGVPAPESGTFHIWDVKDPHMKWDEMLAEQPEIVKMLRDAGGIEPIRDRITYNGITGTPDDPQGLMMLVRGPAVAKSTNPMHTRPIHMSDEGSAIWETLKEWGGENGKRAQKYASSWLRGADIPGHSYLGNSSGIRNYVTYHHDDITPLGTWPSLRAAEADPKGRELLRLLRMGER